MSHAARSPLNSHTHNPESENFTITCISQSDCLRSPCQKLKHPQPSPATPSPLPPCNPMSSSFWADACNSAVNRPLETQLDTVHASCGVTVRRSSVRVVCVARGW